MAIPASGVKQAADIVLQFRDVNYAQDLADEQQAFWNLTESDRRLPYGGPLRCVTACRDALEITLKHRPKHTAANAATAQ